MCVIALKVFKCLSSLSVLASCSWITVWDCPWSGPILWVDCYLEVSISCYRNLGKSDCFIDEVMARLNFEVWIGVYEEEKNKPQIRGNSVLKGMEVCSASYLKYEFTWQCLWRMAYWNLTCSRTFIKRRMQHTAVLMMGTVPFSLKLPRSFFLPLGPSDSPQWNPQSLESQGAAPWSSCTSLGSSPRNATPCSRSTGLLFHSCSHVLPQDSGMVLLWLACSPHLVRWTPTCPLSTSLSDISSGDHLVPPSFWLVPCSNKHLG